MKSIATSDYFAWLISLVGVKEGTLETLTYMFDKDFIWSVAFDQNRAVDGLTLRDRFNDLFGINIRQELCLKPVSVLEVLISVANHLSFVASEVNADEVSKWFWELMENLGLDRPLMFEDVAMRIDRWLYRDFDYDGTGGLFPLRHPLNDQRKVEIWSQLNSYLLERRRPKWEG